MRYFHSAAPKDVVVAGAERTTFWPQVQEAGAAHELADQTGSAPEQGGFLPFATTFLRQGQASRPFLSNRVRISLANLRVDARKVFEEI